LCAAFSKKSLDGRNIAYVLNTASELSNDFPNDYTYLNFKLRDKSDQHMLDVFDEAHKFINMARDNKKGVLVHCARGVSRSSTVVIAYLMKEKWMEIFRSFSVCCK